MTFRKLLAGLLAGFALAAAPLRAQVQGRVVDSRGEPVAGAHVELWATFRRLDVWDTGPSGTFEFDAAQADSASGLIVSRVGYVDRTLSVSSSDEPVTVVLQESAVRLEGLVARAEASPICPNRDEPEARALWEAATARYSRPDTLTISASSVRMENEVPWAEIGVVHEDRLRNSGRATGPQRRAIRPRLGYGFRLEASWSREYAAWDYFELGSNQAQHFTDPSFGTYNSLSVRARTPDATVLAFCSRDLPRGAVKIEGMLTLRPDTTFASARWRFLPPRPREDAGGAVTFVPHPGGGRRPWLVPASHLYWRRVNQREDRYVQIWERFRAWGEGLTPPRPEPSRPAAESATATRSPDPRTP